MIRAKRPKLYKANLDELDRLSSLPDKILLRILSFLPTSDAVKTIALRRFGNLWTKLKSFDFDEYQFQPSNDKVDEDEKLQCLRFLRFINDVMMVQRKHNVEMFRLKFWKTYHSDIEKWKVAKRIETWLRQVKKSGVEVLELSFYLHEPGVKMFAVPCEIFKSQTLIELVLESCDVNIVGVHMPCLRILRLNNVPLDKNDLDEFIFGCPVLQDLTIANCDRLLEVSLNVQNIQKLKIVKDEITSNQIMISCSSVKYFEFVGYVKHVTEIIVRDVLVATLDLKASIEHPKVLKISKCRLELNCKLIDVKKGGDLAFVRSLLFENVVMSDRLLQEFVSACPALEALSVIHCRGLKEITLLAPRPACLSLSHKGKSGVKINCPKLSSLTLSGSVGRVRITSLTSLRSASIEFNFNKLYDSECALFWLLLRRIRHAEVLILSENSFLAFIHYVGLGNSCPGNLWKHVILYTYLRHSHISALRALLKKSLRLEELTICDMNCEEDSAELYDRQVGFGSGNYRSRKKCDSAKELLNYTCLKKHLKKVTIQGGSRSSYTVQYEIADIIRENAIVLEEFVICPELH